MPNLKWILRTACAQASRRRSGGFPGSRAGVNLIAAQFRSGNLPRVVREVLDGFRLSPDALELEVSENTVLHSDGRITTDPTEVRAMVVGLAFDDHGTGCASLTMLKTTRRRGSGWPAPL